MQHERRRGVEQVGDPAEQEPEEPHDRVQEPTDHGEGDNRERSPRDGIGLGAPLFLQAEAPAEDEDRDDDSHADESEPLPEARRGEEPGERDTLVREEEPPLAIGGRGGTPGRPAI